MSSREERGDLELERLFKSMDEVRASDELKASTLAVIFEQLASSRPGRRASRSLRRTEMRRLRLGRRSPLLMAARRTLRMARRLANRTFLLWLRFRRGRMMRRLLVWATRRPTVPRRATQRRTVPMRTTNKRPRALVVEGSDSKLRRRCWWWPLAWAGCCRTPFPQVT